MQAIVQDVYGGPEVLRLAEVPDPAPRPGEIIVQVKAASVNAADWHMMRGDPLLARLAAPELGLRRPKVAIRGRDFAGVVTEIGADAAGFAPGDEVFGELPRGGTFAELVAADPALVARKPDNLSFVEAAAVPLAGVTALMAVRDQADVRPGQRVLISGASGGVGTFAVQLATAASAHVTALCSTRNLAQARSLGADEVVDYTAQPSALEAGTYDAVIVAATDHTLTGLRRLLAPGGVLVIVGGDSMGLLARAALAGRVSRDRITVLMASPSRTHLDDLRALIEQGRIRPAVEETYPLHDAPAAIAHLERDARAKVVVTIP